VVNPAVSRATSPHGTALTVLVETPSGPATLYRSGEGRLVADRGYGSLQTFRRALVRAAFLAAAERAFAPLVRTASRPVTAREPVELDPPFRSSPGAIRD
jgi:hypothetical protein